MVIRLGDRIADVIAADERMIEVFIAASPRFEALREPVMRKTMARLATAEQAARVGGIEPEFLLAQLNAGAERSRASENPAPQPQTSAAESTAAGTHKHGQDGMSPMEAEAGQLRVPEEAPHSLRAVPVEKIVDLDVRDALREGQEPFSQIMAARRTVPEGGALRLRAIFEPAPLYAVMQKQGFAHWTQELAHDDWIVWFHPPMAAEEGGEVAPLATTAMAAAGASDVPDEEGNVHILDVRGLEPPEPMVRTLALLADLPEGATLVQINQRVPHFLLPKLDDLGYRYEIREQSEDLVRIFIRRA